MSAVIFDTLKLSKALRATFSAEQADNIAEAVAASTQDHVATKGDLQDLKVEMVKWIVGAIAFNFIGTAGLIIALVRTFGR